MSLYNAKTDTGAESYGVSQFIITKFDDDLNVEASYLVSSQGCTCPAGHRPSCRHRQMLPMLETRVNSAFFLDFDTRQWVDPTGEAKLDEFEMKALGVALSQSEPETASTPLRTTLEQDVMTGHASREDEEANAACAPNRDDHSFRRRM